MTEEIRIPIEDFHRHFVLTHMKGAAAAVFDNLKQEAEKSRRPCAALLAAWIKCKYPQGAFQDDNWFLREVPLDGCYFAHTDFRGYPVPKDQRFIDFIAKKNGEIEAGTFPCSAEIRAQWSGPMPEPLVQERSAERYYILDGQLRVIRHCFHNVSGVPAFIYRGQCSV
jgi:hypothetical protein